MIKTEKIKVNNSNLGLVAHYLSSLNFQSSKMEKLKLSIDKSVSEKAKILLQPTKPDSNKRIQNVFANFPDAERPNNSMRVLKSNINVKFSNSRKKIGNTILPPLGELSANRLGSVKHVSGPPNPMLKMRRESSDNQSELSLQNIATPNKRSGKNSISMNESTFRMEAAKPNITSTLGQRKSKGKQSFFNKK